MSTQISPQQVQHVAELAKLTITEEQRSNFVAAFEETLGVIENLQEAPSEGLEPTHQVTGLENVMREDVVDEEHMFSQAEAVQNAAKSYNGYFVVPRILDND